MAEEQDWRKINYNEGYKNVIELFTGMTLKYIPNVLIIGGFMTACILFVASHN
jgi:hypothetical protein